MTDFKNLKKLFEKHEDESRNFQRIVNPPSKRQDLCACLILEKFVKNETADIIEDCDNHEIFFNVDLEKLAKNITEEEVINLIRCGVHFPGERRDTMSMYTF